MYQQIFKKEKGITLVALVVTIVVLLILAGVSINMVLGNNGLITKAKDAKQQTEQDQVNTEKGMNNLYDEMMSILSENGGSESGGTGDGNEGGTGDEGDGDGDTVDLTGLAIGDLVNYTYDTVAEGYSLLSTQSGYNDQTVPQSTTTLQWKVLNIDEENGTIDLVSSEPTDNTVYFSGAIGYNNGVYLLNDMCAALYSNSSRGITARSINLADTEKHLTATGLAARNAYKGDVQYGTTKTYTGSYAYYPNLYASQPGAGINLAEGATVTQPDLSGVDPYNESAKVYTTPTTETYSQATQGTGLTVTQTYYRGSDISFNETNYGAAGAVLNSSNYYWVASRFADCRSSYAYFGLRLASSYMDSYDLFYSSGYSSYDHRYRLRPVVSLSSDLLDGTKDASGAWNLVTE